LSSIPAFFIFISNISTGSTSFTLVPKYFTTSPLFPTSFSIPYSFKITLKTRKKENLRTTKIQPTKYPIHLKAPNDEIITTVER